MRGGQRVWSETANAFAFELVGTVYKERVETPGQVPVGYEKDKAYVLAKLPTAVLQVLKDPTTRQALIVWPWDAGLEKPPCFFAMQFLYREPDLNTVVYMRSSDEAKWVNDALFFRWAAKQAEAWLEKVALETRFCYLHVFKGSDHYYEQSHAGD